MSLNNFSYIKGSKPTINEFFISIGKKCGVKWNINKHIEKKETQLFDWLITDMNSVNKIINTQNINTLINKDTVKRSKTNPFGITKQNARYYVTTLSKCESLHDVSSNHTNKQVNELIKRLIRRYNRLINLIKNNNLKIYFIRNGEITNMEKNIFINSIIKINPNCNFKLVECCDSIKQNSKYYKNINLNNFKLHNVKSDWKLSQYNWKSIINNIRYS
jgi:hypothetical protein